ncbi:MAG: amidase [Rhodocyclaceae bacterium]|nr:amidase [Rhodocyclaceae bacterium]
MATEAGVRMGQMQGEALARRDGAVGLLAAMREGRLSAEEVARACLARIDQVEGEVRAWAALEPELVLRQARACDEYRRCGGEPGPLHGLPVGIKDIIDTADLPTEFGTPLHAGRRPQRDAVVVTRLRQAGAVILGKTVTTEMATYAPGPTRNPHELGHTPGGSSSGSAAAVAAGMVPLALGTQTNGSVIRPAAFCGVVGFKPSFGLLPRTGVLTQSPALDQLGVFAASVEEAALLADVLAGCDDGDPATRPQAPPRLLAGWARPLPLPPRFALVRTAYWEHAEADTRAAFDELQAVLGTAVEEVRLPPQFDDAWAWHRSIMEADIARHYRQEYERGGEVLSAGLRQQIERGRSVRAVDYADAIDRIAAVRAGLEELRENFDAILTPAAPGTAPAGHDSTGDPGFCTLWTLAGMPALNLPLMHGGDGLPLGLQLVGYRGGDARLLASARWLEQRIIGEEEEA